MNTPHNSDNPAPVSAATPEELAEVHFTKWAEKRGVWPRLTHHEIFLAGHSAATVAMGSELDQVKKWKKGYYDLADAICPESSGVEDLCAKVRALRAELEATKLDLKTAIDDGNRSRQIIYAMSDALDPEPGEHNIDVAKRRMAELATARAEVERLAQTLASEREDGAKLKTRWDDEVNDLRRQLLESQAVTEKMREALNSMFLLSTMTGIPPIEVKFRYEIGGTMTHGPNNCMNFCTLRKAAISTSPSAALLAALESAWKDATVRAREVSGSITLSAENLHALWLASETRKRMGGQA